MFRNALIIGLGLMGASAAMALKRKKLADNISGYDIIEEAAEKALLSGLIDKKTDNLPEEIMAADLLLVCSHLSSYPEIGRAIARFSRPGALITDVGSVKAPALKLEGFLTLEQKKNFVSAHPVAGSENSGIAAAKVDLFEKKKVIITPLGNSGPRSVQTISKLWQSIGGMPEIMKPEIHDAIYAGVSHVPQFLCWCFADFLGAIDKSIKNPDENFRLFTRLAASNPALWQDIFIANNKNISKVIADFYLNFSNIMREIKEGQRADLHERFTRAIYARKHLADSKDDYKETPQGAANFNITTMVPRIIAMAFLEVTGDMEYAGSGFLDFTRPIISVADENVEYLLAEKAVISRLLQSFFDCMDNFYKILERNTRPDILVKISESRGNYLGFVERD